MVDEYGDPIDNTTQAGSGIPFELHQVDDRNADPTTGEPRTVRFIIGRFYPGVDVRDGDRLQDERTAIIYQVDGVTRPQSPVGTPDVRVEIRQLGG